MTDEETVPETAVESRLADELDALSNPQRLRLLHFLTRPRYAEEIADHLGMSRQSALKHIEKLEEHGFVRALHGRRATGPVIEYLVNPARLFAVAVALNGLGKLETAGGPQVRLAEKTVVVTGDPQADAASAAHEPRPAHMLAVSGPAAGTRFALDGERRRWTLGRDADRDLRLANDPFVSGHHAEVQLEPTGPVLVDVYSSNGTFLNFARIPRGGRVPLHVGDVVGIGHTILVYQKD